MRPNEEKQPGRYSIVIDPALVRPLKMVAAGLEMSPPDYVNNRLREIVLRELPEALRQAGILDQIEKG